MAHFFVYEKKSIPYKMKLEKHLNIRMIKTKGLATQRNKVFWRAKSFKGIVSQGGSSKQMK